MYLHIWRARNETAVEMLTCRESGWKIHENSLFHSWNFFCKSEIIIKRKNKTKGWGARSQPDPYRAEAQDSPLHAAGSSFLILECDSCGGFVGKQIQQVKGQARCAAHGKHLRIWAITLLHDTGKTYTTCMETTWIYKLGTGGFFRFTYLHFVIFLPEDLLCMQIKVMEIRERVKLYLVCPV